MEKENKQALYARRVCIIVLAIILFFFVTIIIRTLTRQILVKRMGMDNSFTNIILFDVQKLNDGGDDESNVVVKIDWEELYPFRIGANDNSVNVNNCTAKTGIIDNYKKRVQSIEDKIHIYVTDLLIGYKKIVELANKYEDVIQWSYAPYGEYNGTIKLPDGQLTSYIEQRDINGAADSTISFANYCSENGIDFIYAQAPYKISKTQDKAISGVVDFSNQNADALIERLRQENIDVYDFRDQIDAEGLNHHSLFYRTDHHWRAETGLWASRHILEHLSRQYGYAVDPSLLNQQ